MVKNQLLKVINPLLLLLLILQAVTGLNADALPSGVFGTIHRTGGIAIVSLGLIHLLLNWNWVHGNFFRKPKPEAK